MAAVLMWPALAMSQMSLQVIGTGTYQSNSNLYDLPAGVAFPSSDGFRRSDTLYSYAGQVSLIEALGRQKFFATVSGTGFRYNHFTDLNHTEYSFDGGWNWVASSLFDGTLDVSRARTMVSFFDVIQSELALQTDQRETADIAIHVAPEWDVIGKGYRRTLDEPLIGAPNLRLTETMGQTGLKYLGRAGVTSGFTASYLKGHFDGSGFGFDPSYHQTNFGLTATVGTPDRPVFNGQVGYSRRSSSTGINTVSGLTGSIDYYRALSGKTTMILNASRLINSFLTNTGSEIDTQAGLTLKYQATFKTGFTAGYTWAHRKLPHQGQNFGEDRIDRSQLISFGINYDALTWLSIRPYANLQTRHSDLPIAQFNATVYGVNVVFTWQE